MSQAATHAVAGILLAAGGSSRLGQPKQLVRLGGEALVERALRIATQAGLGPVVVVLGAGAERIQSACRLDAGVVVVNELWEEGIASSIRSGVQRVSRYDVAGAVLMVCDQPALSRAHLVAMMAGDRGKLRASAYAGEVGIPAYFPAAVFGELSKLKGDRGAKQLLKDADEIDLQGGEFEVDTPAELSAMAARRWPDSEA